MENNFKLCSLTLRLLGNINNLKLKSNIQFGLGLLNKISLKHLSRLSLTRPLRLKSRSNMMDISNIGVQNMEKNLSAYVGSLFLGHFDHQQLVEYFSEFGSKLNWDSSYLINLVMDGPNVNKAFEDKLLNCLKEDNGTEFLKPGTCSLHKVHNAFCAGLKERSFDFDTFAVAIHSFFKLSNAKREG